MTAETQKPLKLFYCYARKDKDLRDELDLHLGALKRQNLITSWYDGEIRPGEEWEKKIDDQLQSAHLILLLITPHFIASDYCYSIEMNKALERRKQGIVKVIPLILRSTEWKNTPLGMLQALPTNGKPLTLWKNRDEAYLNIVHGIHQTIETIFSQRATEQVENDNERQKTQVLLGKIMRLAAISYSALSKDNLLKDLVAHLESMFSVQGISIILLENGTSSSWTISQWRMKKRRRSMINDKKQNNTSNTTRLKFVKSVTITMEGKSSNDSFDLDISLARLCMQRKKICYAEDVAEIYKERNEYWASLALKAGYHSLTAVPMLLGEQIFGAFILYMEENIQIDDQQVALLSIAAIHSSIGIQNMHSQTQK